MEMHLLLQMLDNIKCLQLNIIILINLDNGLIQVVLEQWDLDCQSAMGVKLAYPDEEVVCITGEGSIQMCIQELSTCTQYNLPIKILILIMKHWEWLNNGRI
jgi:TPP-dependent 2-oxoacid decarboxylase